MIKSITHKLLYASILGLMSSSYVSAQSGEPKGIDISWKIAPTYDGLDKLDYMLVLKNTNKETVKLKDWELWFNSMFPAVANSYPTHTITDLSGNLFKVQFKVGEIPSQDSLVLNYTSKYKIVNTSTAPNGFYFQHQALKDKIVPVNYVHYSIIKRSALEEKKYLEDLFHRNALFATNKSSQLILPTPAKMSMSAETYVLPANPTIYIEKSFVDQQHFFNTLLSTKSGTLQDANIKVLADPSLGEEAYTLEINKSGISIGASTSKGVFYGLQSIRSLLSPQDLLVKSHRQFPYISVQDVPRYSYRGFMMDISRNFRDKYTIMKYLDIMAAYKLNIFHFHFTDDEGWRIEIPGLPELTAVGANRSPFFDNGLSIAPAYGSGDRSTGGDYLSKEDFIEILKYAKERHITVVPELESPGHGRAAIKAMEARYTYYMQQGNKEEAERYLLHDLDDKSVYNSAQNWTDNVMNPALPSVYSFVEKVIDEFADMYHEAGLKLEKVSLGGDEVPNGVWEKSPKIQALMRREKMKSVHEVWPYYVNKLNEICIAKGLKMAGWEEFGMVNNGKGMRENKMLRNKSNMQLDVWNNMIGGGQEDLAYRLANAGYPTVLISASNLYFDMMWDDTFTEPGLKWATYADLHHSYSLLPESFFANIDTYYSGQKLGKEYFSKHVRLTEEGKANLIGIKGGLWAETVHSEAALDYMVFPRFFSLAERAWSAERDYESEETFDPTRLNIDYTKFITKIGTNELPKWSGVMNYRLPNVGIKEENGIVYANLEYPGFDIYYTVDGSVPSKNSIKYTNQKPLRIQEGATLAFAAIDAQGRLGQVSYIKK